MNDYPLAFFGTPDFASTLLSTLTKLEGCNIAFAVSQPSRHGNKHTLKIPPVIEQAKKLHIPTEQPERITLDTFLSYTKKYGMPDCVVIAAYGQIIPASLLALPPHGWVNLHASLLPKYRGASPITAAIRHGDSTTGVTLMQVTAGLDTGPLISSLELPIQESDTVGSLTPRLATLGATLLQKALLPYLEGRLHAVPQNESEASMTRELKKVDGKIEWQHPAIEIERHIRSVNPWPGAFSTLGGQLIKIHSARIVQTVVKDEPARILPYKDSFIVSCGNATAIQPDLVQRQGKKIQPSSEFLRGARNILGKRFT